MLKILSGAALTLAFAGSSDAATQPLTIEPSKVNAKHIGMCNPYDPRDPYNLNNGAAANSLSPAGAIGSYVQLYQKAYLVDTNLTEYTVKYIAQPRNGVIKSITTDGWTHELYVPNKGYKGNDRYVAEVILKGAKFKVSGFLRPSSDVMSGYDDLCRRLGLPSIAWKISDATDWQHGPVDADIDESASPSRQSRAGRSQLVAVKGE